MQPLRFFFLLSISLNVSLVSTLAYAQETQAVLIWSAFNGEHNLVSTSLSGKGSDAIWSEPEIIYRSENQIVTPTLVKLSTSTTLAVWSEFDKGKSQIYQSSRNGNSGKWSKAEPLIEDGVENLNPNLVNDGRGTLWMFWSGNDGGLDDVFYKTRRLDENQWSEKVQLNDPNEVPDYRPVAELDEFGDILVRWQTYDFLSGQYIEARKVIATEPADSQWLSKAKADMKLEDITLPDYLPRDSAVSLLFPTNQAAQAIRLD